MKDKRRKLELAELAEVAGLAGLTAGVAEVISGSQITGTGAGSA